MTHQPLWKEGPVRTRPVSLRATKKRKFPGPAGKLPQLTSSEVFDGVAVNRCDSPVITPAQTDVVCNQSCEAHFQDTAWLQMISELQPEAQSLLQQFTVTSVIRKASKKQLHQGKVPVMCVLIDAIGIQHTADASVLLRDQTGVIKGTVHHQLLKDYPAHFQTGTALVLRQVGVFSPSTRTHYLNITPNNIVCIYMKEADDNIVIEKLNQFTADDFVLTDSASLVASNQGSNMHHRRMSPGTLFSSATPNVCSNMTRSQTPDSRKTISQTPGKLQSPACIKTVPQSPSCNRTVPQSPVCNRTVLQSPICSRTVLQSPACNRTVLQSPVSNRTVLQSPVCSRTVPQTPACNRTVPRAPACNRTVPRAPACNRVPQSPVSNRTVLEMTDQSKVFNFKTLQASSALHTSAVVNTVVSHGSIESVTHHPGNCGLEDLLSGLDDEMLAEF